MNLRGVKSTPALLAACSAAAIAAASGSAMAAPAPKCPTEVGAGSGKIPFQTIKIYNDTALVKIFAAFEVGLNPDTDLWIQDICNVPDKDKNTLYPYPTTITNRFYINGTTGIPPGGSVTITLPLYTQLVASVNPQSPNQYAEWWQGQNIQIFGQASSVTTPPKAFAYDYGGRGGTQKPMVFNSPRATKPTCKGDGTIVTSCTLTFVTDTGGTLPKYNPSQLVEATLGANQDKVPPPTDGSITSFLYPTQADFDVSYVNQAYLAATMGPVDNDQSGYVGSPTQAREFHTPSQHLPIAKHVATLHRPRRHKRPNFKIAVAARPHSETEQPKSGACRYLPRADELAYHRVGAYPDPSDKLGHLWGSDEPKMYAQRCRIHDVLRRHPRCERDYP